MQRIWSWHKRVYKMTSYEQCFVGHGGLLFINPSRRSLHQLLINPFSFSEMTLKM